MFLDNINWETLSAIAAFTAALLTLFSWILYKVMGLGKLSQRIEEMDRRTCMASCEGHDKDISSLKQDIKSTREEVIVLRPTLEAICRDMENIRRDMENIKSIVTKHDQDITEVKQEIKTMKEGIDRIGVLASRHDEDITRIKSVLAIKYKETNKVFAMKKSPRRLNEFGLQVYREIEGEKFLNENRQSLYGKIGASQPITAYDVEKAAHISCITCADEPIFNRFKNFVYNAPSYTITDSDGKDMQYELSLEDICFILSIPLRDMYLADHSEIESE